MNYWTMMRNLDILSGDVGTTSEAQRLLKRLLRESRHEMVLACNKLSVEMEKEDTAE